MLWFLLGRDFVGLGDRILLIDDGSGCIDGFLVLFVDALHCDITVVNSVRITVGVGVGVAVALTIVVVVSLHSPRSILDVVTRAVTMVVATLLGHAVVALFDHAIGSGLDSTQRRPVIDANIRATPERPQRRNIVPHLIGHHHAPHQKRRLNDLFSRAALADGVLVDGAAGAAQLGNHGQVDAGVVAALVDAAAGAEEAGAVAAVMGLGARLGVVAEDSTRGDEVQLAAVVAQLGGVGRGAERDADVFQTHFFLGGVFFLASSISEVDGCGSR